MAENKTKATTASVADYIASRAKGPQADDCKALNALFKKITRKPPKMWGPSIVGFGSYTYTYDSGRSGEAPLAGYAIRGRELVVYLGCELEGSKQQALLGKLGKHRTSKSCLYIKQLADIDGNVLEQLVVESIDEVKKKYG